MLILLIEHNELALPRSKICGWPGRIYDSHEWAERIELLQQACQHADQAVIFALLKQLVPEF